MIAPLSILSEIINPTAIDTVIEADAALPPPPPPSRDVAPTIPPSPDRSLTLPTQLHHQRVPSPKIPPRTDKQPPPAVVELPKPVASSQNSLLEPYVITATLETVPGGTPIKPPAPAPNHHNRAMSPKSQQVRPRMPSHSLSM